MENELLKIFDDHMNMIGVEKREDVHKNGYWHETFHCWITLLETGKLYLLFQKRSADKKDYPNFLDITSAGHILAHESKEEGIRELEEELGIDVKFEQLELLDTIKYEIRMDEFWDREIAHVYLYHSSARPIFDLQTTEVSAVYKIDFFDIMKLFYGEIAEVVGYDITTQHSEKAYRLTREDFVAHDLSYYYRVFEMIRNRVITV